MRKYKLNKEYQDKSPSVQETNELKDFGQLTASYDKVTKRRKKPLYKDPKAFIALILILVITWLVFESIREENKDQRSNKIENTDKSMSDSSNKE